MKKLLALILTTALVFSLAAPAMAANWSTPGESTTSSIKITAFEKLVASGSTLGGRVNYSKAPSDIAVYPGAPITVGASISVPRASLLPSGVNLRARFSFDNAAVSGSVIRSVGSTDVSYSFNGVSSVEIELVADAVNTIIVPAFVSTSASVTATVSVASGGTIAAGSSKTYSNGLTVLIKADSKGVPTEATVSDGNDNQVRFSFLKKSSYQSTVEPYSWYIKLANDTANQEYKINDTNGTIQFTYGNSNTAVPTSGFLYRNLTDAYESFAKKLGFGFKVSGVIFSAENVEHNFGNAANELSLTYSSYSSGIPTIPVNPTTPAVTTPALGNGTTTGKVNLRQGPSTSNKKITTLKKGVALKLISLSNGWYEVEYNGIQGYVFAKYVKRK